MPRYFKRILGCLTLGLLSCAPAQQTQIVFHPTLQQNPEAPVNTSLPASISTHSRFSPSESKFFQALGGSGRDPKITRSCQGQVSSGDQGYAQSTAREYRHLIEKLIQLSFSHNHLPSPQPGAIFGAPLPIAIVTPYSPSGGGGGGGGGGGSPWPLATSDISIIEKNTFFGKIYDDNQMPLDGVTVKAKSLNSSVPFEASTVSSGGYFAFNNAPSGVQVEITASRAGFTTRKRVDVLKSNKAGDPNANRYDFGVGANLANSPFSSPFNALSDKPEVSRMRIVNTPGLVETPKGVRIQFSEPMDRSTVEKNLGLYRWPGGNNFIPTELLYSPDVFQFTWNSDDTEVELPLPTDIFSAPDLKDFSWSFRYLDGTIKDKSGIARQNHYFKVTEGDFETVLGWFRLNAIVPRPSNLPTPEPTPTPISTSTPLALPSLLSLSATPLPPPQNPRESFYFTYDDSASTAGVELSKAAINHGQRPDPAWARPWEFLNYENFDSLQQESTGQFKVSMGLWKYPHPAHPLLDRFELGVHVSAPVLCKATRKNTVLTVVADISNSMTAYTALADEAGQTPPTRMELLKAGLEQLLTQLKPGDVLNLITFANKPIVEIEGLNFGEDLSPYLKAIAKISHSGNTNLARAIEEGYRIADRHNDPNKLNRVLFITDALPTEGSEDLVSLKALAARRNQQGIFLSALGMGFEHNQTLLNALTEAGRGAYYSVVSKMDMREAMGDKFIPLIALAARNVRFKIEYPGQLYHGASSAEQISKDPGQVQPTNFSANTSQYFWEQFQANQNQKNILEQSIRLEIRYTDNESRELKTEIYQKTVAELLGKDKANIQAAHLIHLFTDLSKGQITGLEAHQELTGLLNEIGK